MKKNKHIKTVLIDDDANSRKLLSKFLSYHPEIEVVGEAENISGAVKLIQKEKPNSVFLDIELKNENGFDLLDKLNTGLKIVFVSSYDSYAIKAFSVDAVDYIQKPIDKKRLELTIEKLLKENGIDNYNGNGKNGNAGNKKNFKSTVEILTSGLSGINTSDDDGDDDSENVRDTNSENKGNILDLDDRIFVSNDGISNFIKIKQIVCITAEKDYTYIWTEIGKKYLILKPMVKWEQRLTSKYFVRIHRSTIINLEFVEKIEKWFNSSYHVKLRGIEKPFQMSRRYAAKLKERFK